jgi:hypothetical protein
MNLPCKCGNENEVIEPQWVYYGDSNKEGFSPLYLYSCASCGFGHFAVTLNRLRRKIDGSLTEAKQRGRRG